VVNEVAVIGVRRVFSRQGRLRGVSVAARDSRVLLRCSAG
jgi:hypothetical protein